MSECLNISRCGQQPSPPSWYSLEHRAAADYSIRKGLRIYRPLLELEWSGWQVPHDVPHLIGRFYWHGVATFNSGRRNTVFYQWPCIAGCPEDMGFDGVFVQKALRGVQGVIDLGRSGYLKNWMNGAPVRPVKNVEWFVSDLVSIKLEGIQ